MKTLPRIGERTMAFAHVLHVLAGESDTITVSDKVLITKTQDEMTRLCGSSSNIDGWWKKPEQAVRDSLQMLDRLGAIEFTRRRRGRPSTRKSKAREYRTVTLNRGHFLWSLFKVQEVST
jgi:hypothetical protein